MSVQTTVDLSKYIEARLFENRPHVRGRRVPVATIAHNKRTNGWDIAELAYQFTLTEEQVLAALLYYAEHKDEIDAQERAEQEKLNEMKRLHGGN